MSLPAIDTEYLLHFLTGLLETPSPTGFTDRAMAYVRSALEDFPGLEQKETSKGILIATWPGKTDTAPRALTAHVDTLGAMVKEIKSNGRLKLFKIGGLVWGAVETEGVSVFTRGGEVLRGSLLLNKASAHVYGKDAQENKRDADTMEVRLDARTTSAAETRSLGVSVGDFVAFDPRIELNNGFIRSRFLDDKACVACVMTAIKAIQEAGLQPAQKTYLHFSNYEEVGHGAATGIPSEVVELLTVDMAAVGDGQSSDEFHATLCVMDAGGPYHHTFNQRLLQLAEEYDIAYVTDIYPYYGSDGEAFWRAGGDVAVALLGPGVDASHNYERTHMEALHATTQWLLAYLLAE